MRPSLKSLLSAEVTGSDFTWQREKNAFNRSMTRPFGRTDFFITIGQKWSLMTNRYRPIPATGVSTDVLECELRRQELARIYTFLHVS